MSIHITINKEHKSIQAGINFILPEFSVLMGNNGSGKSHLFEAMSKETFCNILINKKLVKNIVYIPFNGLVPNIKAQATTKTITDYITSAHQHFDNLFKRLKHPNPAVTFTKIRHNVTSENNNFNQLILAVLDLNHDIHKITIRQFYDAFDPNMLEKNNMFIGQFAILFKDYHRRIIENDLNTLYLQRGLNLLEEPLEQEEFLAKNGEPPWDFINRILSNVNLPFRVNNPLSDRLETPFNFQMIHNQTNISINHQDLSTGEKVLMSLALAIYNTDNKRKLPDLLILDEPDAGLHPSLMKNMVTIIENHIVEKAKVPVIFSTHSPTTVAACPGLSLYCMNAKTRMPEKMSLNQAIDDLAKDIPNLKISMDPRRQVFVESKNDVIFYSNLHAIIQRDCKFTNSPIFLPARSSTGSNCFDVIKLVTDLNKNGNDLVYGIVDWDKKNDPNKNLLVLGYKKRYSIESFLFDPLIMTIFLLRENIMTYNELGIDNIHAYTDLKNISIDQARRSSHTIMERLKIPMRDLQTCRYQNGWLLKIPSEFLIMDGHVLEKKYTHEFPKLSRFHKEGELKKAIITTAINDFPEFLAVEIIELFEAISN